MGRILRRSFYYSCFLRVCPIPECGQFSSELRFFAFSAGDRSGKWKCKILGRAEGGVPRCRGEVNAGGGLGKEIVRTGVLPRYRGGAFVRHYMMVNRGPAKGCVWPVIAPAEGSVRAGGCVRSMPVVRYWDVLCSFAPIIRSCRSVLCSITPAVCRMSAKQDGLRYVPFLFRRGS